MHAYGQEFSRDSATPRARKGKAADLPALVLGAVDLALVVVGADDPGSTPRVSDVRTAALTVQSECVN